MSDFPDKMPDDLPEGDGTLDRANVEQGLRDALDKTLHAYLKKRPMTNMEVVGALQWLVLETFHNAVEEDKEEGDD